MSRHDDSVRLRHMLEYANEAVAMAKGRTRTDLDNNRQLTLSLTRLLEILGEAAARISPASRERYPTVPWQDIVGMRNRLIHGYDDVDLDVLWDTVTFDLPEVIAALGAKSGSH